MPLAPSQHLALGTSRVAPCTVTRILRFLVVGALGTAFSYSVYAALFFAGLNYAASNFAALVAGILFSFKMQGTFVFDNPDNRLIWRFVICWLAIYAANVLFIRQMIASGWSGYAAGALAVPPIAVLSYVTQRFFVFRPADESSARFKPS